MRRQDPGPSRRERRSAQKGEPAGRRVTHPVETAYGRHQKDRDMQAVFSAMCAALREDRASAAPPEYQHPEDDWDAWPAEPLTDWPDQPDLSPDAVAEAYYGAAS